MARKLLGMMALISLLLLVQATPGLASSVTYDLPGGDSSIFPSPWTEARGYNIYYDDLGYPIAGLQAPGLPNGELRGGFLLGELSWEIGNHTSSDPAQVLKQFTTADPETGELTYWVTYKIAYDSGNLNFVAQNYGGPNISSTNTVITTIATYRTDESYTPINQNGWYCKDQLVTMEGVGDNSDGTPFTFTADLREVYWDHNHSGYVDNFQLTYGATAAQTPIPGAIWLLGTGLVGLGCLGRRRRKS